MEKPDLKKWHRQRWLVSDTSPQRSSLSRRPRCWSWNWGNWRRLVQKYSGVQTGCLSDSTSSNLGMRSGGGGEVESRRGLRAGERSRRRWRGTPTWSPSPGTSTTCQSYLFCLLLILEKSPTSNQITFWETSLAKYAIAFERSCQWSSASLSSLIFYKREIWKSWTWFRKPTSHEERPQQQQLFPCTHSHPPPFQQGRKCQNYKSSFTESTGSIDPAENGGLFEKGKLVEFLFRVVSCNEKGKVKKYGQFTIFTR